MRPRLTSTLQTLCVGVGAMLQAVASTQTAREAGRRGNFAETPVAVVFRMEDAYLAVWLEGGFGIRRFRGWVAHLVLSVYH
jgi:hypothetical protein